MNTDTANDTQLQSYKTLCMRNTLFVKYLLVILNIPRLIPAVVFLLVFRKECEEDVRVNKAWHSCRLPFVAAFCYMMVFEKWFRNVFYYRIGRYKYLISFLAPPVSTFFIGTYARIGKGFLAVHPYATNVNAKSIGDYFTVKNNVTIGENKGGIPIIGNKVTINVNAVVLGDIIIGDNVTVGAGTVLMKSVPDNCVVVGNPAYILRRDGVLVNEKL